ncbi:DNA (cytosine-5)-methyltransferase 1 [Selenomonas sp. GACV-9]|uniref:DNA (cytosine-5-)-methyltransferase n=1 Tax=Selenomonas sp. GACV-9 TaxID=3158782 RepID=UPI0008EAB1A8|nr:DNA (cytosine-5)-methyltransferase 1 [Selenomonas ruminantium]
MDKTLCELFAGVGGFRVGLERSSQEWDTVWANQWEPSRTRQDAFDCYCAHFGKKDIYVNEDIGNIDKSSIPDHTLLVGGFPCQDYSVARTGAKGIEGKKGVLWWQIREILDVKRPPFVLLENVDRLLKSPASKRGRDFGIILASFWEFGYSVEWRVINAADYGFVQRRRRTFIFAYRNDTNYGQDMAGHDPLEAINQDGFFARTFPIEECPTVIERDLPSQDLYEITQDFSFPFETAGYMHDGHIATAKAVPAYHGPHRVLADIMDHDVDEKYYIGDDLEKWTYLKGAKRIERTSRTGHKYIFSEGPIAFPDPIDRPARTMLTSEATTNRSTHVVRDLDTGRLRLLTPNETNKIQGFPEHWTDTGMSERFQYFCMGNALVTDCVEKMGETLNNIIDQE